MINIKDISVGTDIELVSRFKNLSPETDQKFLNKIYTSDEIKYCYSKKQPEFSLAGRYAGKEAVIKALTSFDVSDLAYRDIEISNNNLGVPQVSLGKRKNEFDIKISLSHCENNALAFVIAKKKA